MPSRNYLALVLGGLAAAQEMDISMDMTMDTPTSSAVSSSMMQTVGASSTGDSSSAATATSMTMMSMPTDEAASMAPSAAVPLGTAVSWSYFNTTVTTVNVVASVSTVCAEPTTYTFNDCEYPVTAGQTLVVTDCPCTVTTTMPVMTSTPCPVATAAAAVPPGNANAPAGEAPPATSVFVAPTAPTSMPSAVQVAGAPAGGGGGNKSLLGLVAALGAAVLMRAV